MATTLAWGENALVTMSLGFLVNQFTLDDAIYGQLDGVGVLDGNLEGIDVTEYVKSVQLRRGRSGSLDNFEAGSATIVLNNNDRGFDPINETTFAVSGFIPAIHRIEQTIRLMDDQHWACGHNGQVGLSNDHGNLNNPLFFGI